MNRKRKYSDMEEDDSDAEKNLEDYNIEHPEIKNIIKNINKDELTIQQILNYPLLSSDRVELFQLYEVYKNLNTPSLEHIEMRKMLKTKFNQAKNNYELYIRFSAQEHTHFENELKRFSCNNQLQELKYQILQLETSDHNKQIILSEYNKLLELKLSDDEYPKIKNWLYWAVSIPYDKITPITINIEKTENILNERLYGMTNVKEQILVYLHTRMMNPNMKRCSLGLIGPPGCGKTAIAKVIAELLGCSLQQISLGGIISSDFLKGHQSVYIGSSPGEIVKCLSRMKSGNGILYFDEFDKVSNNTEICSALLHITDPEQNCSYRDNFLDGLDINLSNLLFIYSMNSKPTDIALSDRVFYISVPGYTDKEKIIIIKKFLLKNACENIGLKNSDITIEEDAFSLFFKTENYGLREIKDNIHNIVNKIHFLYHNCNNYNNCNKKRKRYSFDINRKIIFPICLTKEEISILISV